LKPFQGHIQLGKDDRMKDPRTGKIGILRRPLIVELIAQGKTAHQIADHLNVNPETVRKFARKRGYRISSGQPAMENHPMWCGGMTHDRSGYLLIRVSKHSPYGYLIRALGRGRSNGYAPQHRIVMHDQLGRQLKPFEVVDHIDGNLKNNEPSNLRVFASNAEHLRATLTGKIPKWTPEGRAKMTGRLPDPNSANQRRLAKHRQSKNDDRALPSLDDLIPS